MFLRVGSGLLHVEAELPSAKRPFSRAELLLLKGDVRGAKDEMERSLALHTKSPRGLYFAGRLDSRTGDLAKAVSYLETMTRVLAAARGSATGHYRDALEAEIALARGEGKKLRYCSNP